MGKKQETPTSGSMKQKSIASFFAAKAKTSSPSKPQNKPGTPATASNNKENLTTPASHGAACTPPTAAAANTNTTPQHTPVAAAAAAGTTSKPPAATPRSAAGKPPLSSSKKAAAGSAGAKTNKASGSAAGTKAAPAAAPAAVAATAEGASGSGSSNSGAQLVGRHLEVFWPLDQQWFEGKIVDYSEEDGKHHVEYDDGDDEWLDLVQERHRLLPAGGPGAAAAAARKQHRKARLVDSDDDDDDDDDQDAAAADSDGADSDFKAGDDEGDDEEMEELEDEMDDDAAAAGDDEEEDEAAAEDVVGARGPSHAAGSKRKRAPAAKASRKRPASNAAVTAATTPKGAAATAGAAAGAGGAGSGVGPRGSSHASGLGHLSSAGHTPMDRFSCGTKSTPPHGFSALTPPAAATAAASAAAAAAGNGSSQGADAGTAEQTPNVSGFFRFRPVSAGGSSAVSGGSGGGVTPGVDRTPGGVSPGPSLPPFTPDTAAKAALQGALDLTPGGEGTKAKTEPRLVLGVLASGGAEAARFAARMAERFNFLHPDKIRDKAGKRPSDPEYNPRTLRIPDGWFKTHKVTEAQQQWWGFKANNFDSVLLFKVGKFYEMFEMDAFVGVDVLGLSFMKGDQPHAGFPEAAYHTMAEQLARAGYRVVVVEQTETPEQLKARNAARPAGTKMSNVVERQAVAVLSRGTLMDPEMVAAHPDAAYVLAVVELADAVGHDAPFIGVCALDAAAGQLLIGSWRDDEVRLKLRTQLTGLRPVEVVLPRRDSGVMSGVTSRLVRCGASRGPEPALNELPASSAEAEAALKALSKYFPEDSSMPELLQQLKQQYSSSSSGSNAAGSPGGAVEGGEGVQVSVSQSQRLAESALGAVGLMLTFLQNNMLDTALLPHAKYEQLCEGVCGSDDPVCMELNGAALEGLEVLENALGGPQGSLLGLLDHCVTPFGRRRLRRWLTRPLFRIPDITRRQDAVEELMGPADAAVGAARRALAGCSDLERCLARLAASVGAAAAAGGEAGPGSGSGAKAGNAAGGFGREAAHVVLYEDVARRHVRVLVGAMKDLKALQAALEAFGQASPQSELLSALSDPSRWSDFAARLDEMSAAAEWQKAEADGVVRPSRAGLDPDYDAAQEAVQEADRELQAYLVRVRKQLDCRSVSFTSLNKESHVLEVPESAAGRMPGSFSLVGHRKGFKRYMTEELQELVAARQAAEEDRDRVQAGVLRNLQRLFVSHHELWTSAIEAVGVLDCLMALAGAALAADGTLCRPVLLEAPLDPQGLRPSGGVFRAKALRHPAGIAGTACGSFVPNDVSLGGDAPGFILLTGPNMGGKSTLLRQVCLAAVLAQVGALVPAEHLELTPLDGCFVRMGARDAILSGQSTFFIEMAETAAMLSRATPRSLVALDELGRGTATLDGAATAAAVLDHLAHTTCCCGLFATHYHQLAAEHASDPQVAIMHMACAVAEQQQTPQQQQDGSSGSSSEEEPVTEVTFLYKLTPGACPKSYGTNVARLAGLPASVVSRAAAISASREAICTASVSGRPQKASGPTEGVEIEAMDVDGVSKGTSPVQQLLCKAYSSLQQLKDVDADDCKQLQQHLVQLQQQARMLCKC